MDERLSPPWQPWEAIPVALAAYAGTAVVSVLLALVFGGVGGVTLQLTILAFPVLLAAVTVAWVAGRYRRAAVPALRIRSRRGTADVVFGAWSGAALFAVVLFGVAPLVYFLVGLFTGGAVTPPQQDVLPTDDPNAWQVLLGAAAVVVAAPIGEEIFFRGFLFGSLRSRFGFWASAAISGAVFAAVHILPLLMPLMFVVGIGLALIYERRGSLVASMAAHAAFNTIGFTFILLQ
ncbi:MAG TPA: type II CAAX endopeptidase family protein [Actinomycetota bacterium]|nr:type II CAAX endopeptidase family protein [Actinomycetota bacterium]